MKTITTFGKLDCLFNFSEKFLHTFSSVFEDESETVFVSWWRICTLSNKNSRMDEIFCTLPPNFKTILWNIRAKHYRKYGNAYRYLPVFLSWSIEQIDFQTNLCALEKSRDDHNGYVPTNAKEIKYFIAINLVTGIKKYRLIAIISPLRLNFETHIM